MEERVAFEFIKKAEKELNLYKYKYGGFYLFPLVRFPLFCYLTRSLSSEKKNAPSLKDKVINKLLSLEGLLQKNFMDFRLSSSSLPPVVFFPPSNSRRDKVGDRFKDIFFDDLYPLMKGRIQPLVVELPTEWQHLSPVAGPRHILGEVLDWYQRGEKIDKELREIVAKMEREVGNYIKNNKLFGNEIPPLNFNKILFFWWKKHNAVKKVLQIAPFRLCLVECSYTRQYIVTACRSLGIPTAEPQHGLIDQYHPGYIYNEYWMKDFESMPLPDFLLVYGDFWKEDLIRNGGWSEDRVLSLGSARVEFWREKMGLNSAGEKPQRENRVLVTTQPVVAKELSLFMEKTAQIIKEKEINIKIDLKLHPRDLADKNTLYRWTHDYKEEVEILTDRDKNLFELLVQSSFHASVYSTCHFEALAFDTPTIVVKLTNWERMKPLLDRGWAGGVETPEELAGILEKQEKTPSSDMESIRRQIWSPGAIQNQVDFILYTAYKGR